MVVLGGVDLDQKKRLAEFLDQFITPERKALMHRASAERTRRVTVVLEDIFQPHNGSAALRSCECFGVQDVHIIENRYKYRINGDVVMGANKWLNLHRYKQDDGKNTVRCFKKLKAQGYRIAATALREDTIPLPELPLDEKVAICFGTEETGMSEEALEMADCTVKIPMYGFTQSYNISVSVALCLYDLIHRLRSTREDWPLTEEEQLDIRLQWLKASIKRSDIHQRVFHELGIPTSEMKVKEEKFG